MSNNNNPFDVDGRQIKNKTWDNAIIRATVIDVLPEFHAVRVNPRGDNSPLVVPVHTPMYGSHTLPGEGERVTVLYITENVPVVVGSIYLSDVDEVPDVKVGDLRIGNDTGSHVTVHEDGHISIVTDEREPVNINHQAASVHMSSDQGIGSGGYQTVNFDTIEYDPEDLFAVPSSPGSSFTVRDSGLHRVQGTVEIQSAGQNNVYTLALFRNGSVMKQKSRQSSVNEALSLDVTTNQNLDEDDVIDVRVQHDDNESHTVNGSPTVSEFNIQRQGI